MLRRCAGRLRKCGRRKKRRAGWLRLGCRLRLTDRPARGRSKVWALGLFLMARQQSRSMCCVAILAMRMSGPSGVCVAVWRTVCIKGPLLPQTPKHSDFVFASATDFGTFRTLARSGSVLTLTDDLAGTFDVVVGKFTGVTKDTATRGHGATLACGC